MTTLASPQLWIGLGIVGFLFVSLTMILIVLIQKPQGGGLSGAFGSSSDAGGAGQTAFGAKTGDVLTTLTISIFIVFLVSAAGLNYMIRPSAAPAQEDANAASGTGGNQGTGTTSGTGSPSGNGGTNTPPIQIDGSGISNIRPVPLDENGNPILPDSITQPGPVPAPTEGDPPAGDGSGEEDGEVTEDEGTDGTPEG